MQKSSKKKIEFSKKICTVAIIQFILCIAVCLVVILTNHESDIYSYLIPTSGTIATAGLAFYSNKAKAENLSKQKLRNILLKTTLEEELSPEKYTEICQELDNIDEAISNQLDLMQEETMEENSNISLTQ